MKVGKEGETAVWGPLEPPDKLGIRGTYVAVDWDICEGCGICLEVCPVQMYEWVETPDHPTSKKKAFPAKELECVQCYKCETQCPVQAIRIIFPGPTGWEGVVVPLMFSQIMGGVIYGALFGPYLGLKILFYIGWLISVVGLLFFFSPAIYYPKSGKPGGGKGVMDTTVLVDSGTYAIIRHPQTQGCILLVSASVLISQHWLAAIVGILISVRLYMEAAEEERGLKLKFGDDYKRYMEKVPRMNLLAGIIRLLRRRQRVKIQKLTT